MHTIPTGTIRNNIRENVLVVSSGNSQLTLKLDYNCKCIIKEVWINGRQVLSAGGACSAIKTADGTWYTTRCCSTNPIVNVCGNIAVIESIRYGGRGGKIDETWTLSAFRDYISWKISRKYRSGGKLLDTCLPEWEFQKINTWTGALLDNGGVAWMKLLNSKNRTLGTHSGTVTFWDKKSGSCFRIAPAFSPDVYTANRFTTHPNGTISFCNEITSIALTAKYELQNFRDSDEIWNPFDVDFETISVDYKLSALDYNAAYDIGTLSGLDGSAIREMSNTIARYGVIDNNHAGLNGWMSGYVCLHEPYIGKVAAAVGQSDYTKAVQNSYSYYKENAIKPNGRVLPRFQYIPGDEESGTRTKSGFYEAQWGMLLDSQPDYVIVTADIFHLTGDINWVHSQKTACEKALNYLLAQGGDSSGLVKMTNRNTGEGRSSDWIDVVWAANENALVNAELYGALVQWANIEDILGDGERASSYRTKAVKLKKSFNKPIGQGGFWDSVNCQYIYWRDKDNSIHGTNLVIPVQFAAIGYGVCDDQNRIKAILKNIENKMVAEGLFSWPLCMTSFAASETRDIFPYYENGDIFLSWNELGLKCYSKYNPDIAVKYIKNVIQKYNSDGLAAQRYLRYSQTGAGDDILAGNYMTVAGLYSSIYGVLPYYNRLYLEPHITPDLSGTILKYQLRGQQYIIRLASQNSYSIQVSKFTVSNSKPFGIELDKPDQISYFTGNRASKTISFVRSDRARLYMDMANFSDTCFAWTDLSDQDITVTHTIFQLKPNVGYRLTVNEAFARTLTTDSSGSLRFKAILNKSAATNFNLREA